VRLSKPVFRANYQRQTWFAGREMSNFRVAVSLSVLIAVMMSTGCARHKVAPPDHGPLKKVAVLPVSNPGLTTRNENFFAQLSGIGSLAQSSYNRDKSKEFAQKLGGEQAIMGEKMTQALVEELRKQGYETELIQRVDENPKDPEDFDYAKLQADGAIVHLWYDEVGMYSSTFRSDYLPRVNVVVRLFYPRDEEYIYDERLYYGADAKAGKNWGILSDPKYRFNSFDALVNNADTVIESLDVGVRAIAERTVQEFQRVTR